MDKVKIRPLATTPKNTDLPRHGDFGYIENLITLEERKVRRYLDDNFTNRPELVTPDPTIHRLDDQAAEAEVNDERSRRSLKKKQFQGTGPRTKDGKKVSQKLGYL